MGNSKSKPKNAKEDRDSVPEICSKPQGEAEPEPNPWGPEAGLGDVRCLKNPNHVGFIPVKEFDKHHLPEEYRQKEVVEMIKSCIPLVVHLGVRYVSVNRPQVYPDSNDPYPFSECRGGPKYRTGSGYVYGVVKCGQDGEDEADHTCSCEVCVESGEPQRSWWEVGIRTAAHVTFDQPEVESTEVRFFYDERHSERHVAKGHKWVHTDLDGDRCEFTVVIHDMAIGKTLKKALNGFISWSVSAYKWWFRQGGLTVVISHPHGCSKFITFGTVMMKNFNITGSNLIAYSTATCPGSSGGMVISETLQFATLLDCFCAPHSEAMPDGRNRSGRVTATATRSLKFY